MEKQEYNLEHPCDATDCAVDRNSPECKKSVIEYCGSGNSTCSAMGCNAFFQNVDNGGSFNHNDPECPFDDDMTCELAPAECEWYVWDIFDVFTNG